MKWDHFYEGLNCEYRCMLGHIRWMTNTPLVTLTCSLQHRNWKDGQKLETSLFQKTTPWLEDQMLPDYRHWGTCFPLGSWRAIDTFMALIHHSGKHWNWGRLNCRVGRGRRGWIFRGRTGNPQWNWWSQAAAQLYHLICQCSQAILPEEKPELFQDGAVLTIWWKIAQRISARSPE